MEKSKAERQSGSPSLLQIRYLIELEKLGKKRGSVAMIAETCGVSHGPVSRFLKSCVERGYLSEQYEFTEEGKVALERYKKLLCETEEYLGRIGIRQEDIPENTRNLIENIDYDVLGSIARSDRHIKKELYQDKAGIAEGDFLGNVLQKGNWKVCIAIHQLQRGTGFQKSMAERGFEHLAVLRHNRRGSWLELTTRKMNARSRIDGMDMEGELSSLKYEENGMLFQAEIKNGKVKIPLEACQFRKSGKGNVKGNVAITVTCSVGRAHMPESTALLTFWL